MDTQALSHFDRMDGIFRGTDTGFHPDLLFDVVRNLLPSSLSRPARLFAAFIVSVLLSYGASYLWKSLFRSPTAGEINRMAADQGEADSAQSGIGGRQ
jgi:hypothetical protein